MHATPVCKASKMPVAPTPDPHEDVQTQRLKRPDPAAPAAAPATAPGATGSTALSPRSRRVHWLGRRRPWGVVAVSVVLLLLTLDELVVVGLRMSGAGVPRQTLSVLGNLDVLVQQDWLPRPVVDTIAIVGGAVLLVLAVGFWLLNRWAWTGVMLLAAVSLTIDVVATLRHHGHPVDMLLCVLAVLYLNRRSIQQLFGTRERVQARAPRPGARPVDPLPAGRR